MCWSMTFVGRRDNIFSRFAVHVANLWCTLPRLSDCTDTHVLVWYYLVLCKLAKGINPLLHGTHEHSPQTLHILYRQHEDTHKTGA